VGPQYGGGTDDDHAEGLTYHDTKRVTTFRCVTTPEPRPLLASHPAYISRYAPMFCGSCGQGAVMID
jgi:hypothetical protein